MSAIPAPNIAQNSLEQEQLSQNAMAEYVRAAQERAQTAAWQQQTQQQAQLNPLQVQQAQEQVKQAQQQTQIGAMGIAQTQAINQAYKDAFKPDAQGNVRLDPDALQQSLEQAGHGSAIPGVMDAFTKYQTGRVDLQAKQQQLQTQSSNVLGNLGYALQQAGYDPKLAHTVIADHLNDPGLSPQQRQQLIMQGAQIDQNPALIKQMADQWVAQSPEQQQKAIERTTAESKNWKDFPALGVSLNVATGEQRSVGNGAMMSPQMMESKYEALAQKKAAGQPLTSDDTSFMKGYEDLAGVKARAMMQAQAGLLSPEARQMAAQYYQQTGAMPAGMRSPAMSAGVLNQAAGTTPGAVPNVAQNKMQYGTEQALQKGFTVGTQGQQLTAINTARNHMATFKEMADALDNGHTLLLNQLGNTLGMQFGSDKATNFNIAKSAFAGEVGKAFAGANVGVQDRQELMDKISAASSPAQLKGYADTADKLLEGKQQSLKQTYSEGMQGRPNFGAQPGAAGGGGTNFFSQFGGTPRSQ